MAEEQPQPSSSNPQLDYSWVADEPHHIVSVFVDCEGVPEDLFTEIQTPPTEDWEVRIPGNRRRICTAWGWGTIHILSQLHPNSLGFLRVFEMTASYLGMMPTVPLFFHAFGLQRSCPKGEKAKGKAPKGTKQEPSKYGWVSFKLRKGLFKMYEESVRGFKEKYYAVLLITSNGWMSIVYLGPKKDEHNRVVIGLDGNPVEEDYAWLVAFVGSFPANLWEDSEGNPLLDIDMTIAQARLRQAKKAKNKKMAAGGLGTSTTMPSGTPSGDVSPTPSIEITHEKRGRGEDLEDTTSRKNQKVDAAGGSLGTGLHRLQPGVPADDLVLPPALRALKNEIADSSVAIFKLLEVVNYLNDRECQYLKKRDVARKKVNDLGQKLTEMKVSFNDYKEKYSLQETLITDLQNVEGKLAEVVKERDALALEVKELKEKIVGLEERLKSPIEVTVIG
ncbi:hypothetical protein A2U01_0000959 [Trifolium medium]|uniref:Uncharacterized protein n=1 Tax=Trifolium medium TaxID=97028 RepID=A0A392LZ18_9FABA|nr:hypothetical protein [Trifolium medium]